MPLGGNPAVICEDLALQPKLASAPVSKLLLMTVLLACIPYCEGQTVFISVPSDSSLVSVQWWRKGAGLSTEAPAITLWMQHMDYIA